VILSADSNTRSAVQEVLDWPMTYRELSAQALAENDYQSFLTELERSLTDGRKDPNLVVQETLTQIYYGHSNPDTAELPLPARAVVHTFDPRNITTEPEYYTDIDEKRYAERKPLMWLWQMFDRSPLGQNALLGHRFRGMLAPYIFAKVGQNFKCWHFVEWSFGYNLSFGNNVVVHRHVLLDDRGGIEIGDDVSISDYVNVYSHSHDIYDIHKVSTPVTRIGNRVRLTYHSTILAGMQVADDSMVGTGAVVTRNVERNHIVLGIPAKTGKVKSTQND
jgi:acetyltransferase-like isoleucine patch superfamily enzyme